MRTYLVNSMTKRVLEIYVNMFTAIATIVLIGCCLVNADQTTEVSEKPGGQACPSNLVQTAQDCFAELADAVNAGHDPKSKTDGMTLDYTLIKEYCAEDGHITKFVSCIENLVSLCKDSPQASMLDRLVSPESVRDAVPTLCKKQDEIKDSSECMNSVMGEDSYCKDHAYAKVKDGMSNSTRNVTAMFLIQCSFFSSLADCQRKAVSEKCGSELGDIHARFLMAFVPSSCGKQNITDIPKVQLDAVVDKISNDTVEDPEEEKTTQKKEAEEEGKTPTAKTKPTLSSKSTQQSKNSSKVEATTKRIVAVKADAGKDNSNNQSLRLALSPFMLFCVMSVLYL